MLPVFGFLPAGPDWALRIRDEFSEAAEGVLDGLLAREEPPSIWNYMATTDDAFFWPVVE